MPYKTVFQYLPNGTRFKAINGDILIKRRGSDTRKTFCYECQKTVRLNAIIPGITMANADNTQFVHFCPMDFVLI